MWDTGTEQRGRKMLAIVVARPHAMPFHEFMESNSRGYYLESSIKEMKNNTDISHFLPLQKKAA